MKPKALTTPKTAAAVAVKQAHAELAVKRLAQAFGRIPVAGMHALTTALLGKRAMPGAVNVDQILSESKRTGRRPSVIAKSQARRVATEGQK